MCVQLILAIKNVLGVINASDEDVASIDLRVQIGYSLVHYTLFCREISKVEIKLTISYYKL